jgi:hypothetical protein
MEIRMNYNLDNLPGHARVWIYQSDRDLTPVEVDLIERASAEFLEEWTTHGKQMTAGFGILRNRFLIIAADESRTMASGCGIDKSTHHVKRLGEQLGVDFFNRMLVSYMSDGQMITVPVHEFWARRKAGVIMPDTLVFNNLIQTLDELRNRWLVPFRDTWHEEMWKS